MQFEQLKKIIGWAYDKSIFYQNSFKKFGVKPADFQSIDDIKKFPVTTLADLNRENSMDFLTLPLSGIVRINYLDEINTANFFTKDEIAKNVEMMTSCLKAAKIYRGSIAGVIGDLSDSKFLDVIGALESMNVTVIHFGKNFIEILDNFTIETLIAAPKNFENLVEQLQAAGKNLSDYPIRKIILLNTNTNFFMDTNIKVYNLFAPPEIGTAGIFFQCDNNSGWHVQDNFFIEIDDETDELVITTLTAQARPLIRYRTRQIVRCTNDFCSCGRRIFQF